LLKLLHLVLLLRYTTLDPPCLKQARQRFLRGTGHQPTQTGVGQPRPWYRWIKQSTLELDLRIYGQVYTKRDSMRKIRSLHLPPPLEAAVESAARLSPEKLVGIFFILFVCGLAVMQQAHSYRNRNVQGWVQQASLFNNVVQQDWIDVEQFHLDLINRYASTEDVERCKRLVTNRAEALSSLDAFIYHTYYKRLRRRGVFLSLTSDAEVSNPASTFERCFGWEGVVVSPVRSMSRSHPRVHCVQRCVHPTAPSAECATMSSILEEYQAILGRKSANGRFGTEISLVVVDLNGREADVLGCTDIRGVFSQKQPVQVWLVNTSKLSLKQNRIIETALFSAGYIPAPFKVQANSPFRLFVLLPTTGISLPFGMSRTCPEGRLSCTAAQLLAGRMSEPHGLPC
jgi:hypothetical protein